MSYKNGTAFGTYTPILTGVANVTSSTPRKCQWSQVGRVVTVSGVLDVNFTSNNTQTLIGISLPVASNFGTIYECSGTAHSGANGKIGGTIVADSTNNRAQLDCDSDGASTATLSYIFSYEVI